MPEDLQKLAENLGGKPNEDAKPVTPDVEEGGQSNEPTPPQDKESVAKDSTTPPNTEDDKGSEPKADSKDDASVDKTLEQEKANRAFAEMRNKVSKYEKAISKYAAMHGVSEEEALTRMQTDALQKEAEEKKVDPELLKRLQESEEQLQALAAEKQEAHLKQEFEAVKDRFNLSDDQVVKFAEELVGKGINIFEIRNIDLVTLYRGLKHDDILKKTLTEEKQNWIKGQSEADAAPGVIPNKGKGTSPDTKKIETHADLHAALNALKNNV